MSTTNLCPRVLIRLGNEWSSVAPAHAIHDPLQAMPEPPAPEGPTMIPVPHLPSDDELLDLVRQWPGICLRQLCALLWPSLSWLDASRAPFPGAAPAPTRAVWVRDRMRTLIGQGRCQLAPFHRDEPGDAGLAYLVPSG